MEQMTNKKTAESLMKDIKRKTHRSYNAEEKIRIVIEGLRGEDVHCWCFLGNRF